MSILNLDNIFEWHLTPVPEKLEAFLKEHKVNGVFLDTNVMFFINSPFDRGIEKTKWQPKQWNNYKYSSVTDALRKIKCKIYIHQVVVSEFASTAFAEAYSIKYGEKGSREDRKKYRSETKAGQEDAKTIANSIQRIFRANLYEILEDKVGKKELPDITGKYAQAQLDFGDLIISNICHKNKLALLTDDKDFAYAKFPIVTATSRLKKKRDRR